MEATLPSVVCGGSCDKNMPILQRRSYAECASWTRHDVGLQVMASGLTVGVGRGCSVTAHCAGPVFVYSELQEVEIGPVLDRFKL